VSLKNKQPTHTVMENAFPGFTGLTGSEAMHIGVAARFPRLGPSDLLSGVLPSALTSATFIVFQDFSATFSQARSAALGRV
jgi:hypothetical protein